MNSDSQGIMGNHPSKAYETQFLEIFSNFSEDEKAALIQVFNEFSEPLLSSHNHEKPERVEVIPLSIKVGMGPSFPAHSLK